MTPRVIVSATGDCILAEVPKQGGESDEMVLNFEQNMQDAIDIMHKLQTGIDVNVKFSGRLHCATLCSLCPVGPSRLSNITLS